MSKMDFRYYDTELKQWVPSVVDPALFDKLSVDVSNKLYKSDFATYDDITYYIDPINGDDSNDGLSENSKLKTMNACFDKLPQIVRNDIYVKLSPGHYDENVSLKQKNGNGTIHITGDSTAPRSYNLNEFSAVNLSTSINVVGITVINNSKFELHNVTNFSVKNCVSDCGVIISGSTGFIEFCEINNADIGLFIISQSVVTAYEITGSNLITSALVANSIMINVGNVFADDDIHTMNGGIITSLLISKKKTNWIELPLLNGWAPYVNNPQNAVRMYVDETNTVFIKGRMDGGIYGKEVVHPCFKIPSEYVTGDEMMFACAGGFIYISATGDVFVYVIDEHAQASMGIFLNDITYKKG